MLFYSYHADEEGSADTETLILDTVKSAVRFQRHVGDALIKVGNSCSRHETLILNTVKWAVSSAV